MTDDDVARLARAAGLDKYLAEYPDQFAAAMANARALAARLPRDLAAAEESAHTFRLPVAREPLK